MRAVRVVFLALAIALGIAGLYLTALILAIGSIVLAPWDVDQEETA